MRLMRLFGNLTKEEQEKYPTFGDFAKIHTTFPGDFPNVVLEIHPLE
jgi:hypothetical protein